MRTWLRFKCLAAVAMGCLGVAAYAGDKIKETPRKADAHVEAIPEAIPHAGIPVESWHGQPVASHDSGYGCDTCDTCRPMVCCEKPWSPPPMMGDMFFGGIRGFSPAGNFQLTEPGGFSRYARISQNGYVIPTSRVFGGYRHLDDVLTGADVNYYNPGFEWAFLENRASIRVNVPLANTIDDIQFANQPLTRRSDEFGNINAWLKVLLARSEQFALSAGLGVNTPTANDVRLFAAPGAALPLLNIQNDSVLLNPFVGWAWTPNGRLFVQSFTQLDIDLNGNPVSALGAPLGDLSSSTLLSTSLGLGYSLYNESDPDSFLSRVTPMVEFHYTTDLGSSERLLLPGGGLITSASDQVDTLNVIGGVNILLGDRVNLNLGAGTPVFGNNRQYDWQVLGQVNILLGN